MSNKILSFTPITTLKEPQECALYEERCFRYMYV